MTNEEIINQIKQLPLERQREILDAIKGNAWEITSPREERTAILERLQGIAKPQTAAHDQVVREGENGRGLAQSLYGILQFDAGPPTDEEVKDMIADYLAKKYY